MASGRSLRRVALDRKNYLFIGDVEADASIAGLYTLVATCEARGINPFACLAYFIPRVQEQPKGRLDELLPGPWARTRAEQPAWRIVRSPLYCLSVSWACGPAPSSTRRTSR